MGAPAGFKLNNDLDEVLGSMFLWLIDIWLGFLKDLEFYLPILIKISGIGGLFGCSFLFAIAEDVVCFLTLHLFLFYSIAAAIFRFHLNMLLSLFHIFRGKKRNILRNRIDDCDYDLDQILLGTILFTCCFFLFPTVLVYYVLFMGTRMITVIIYASFELCLAILYLFPFFTSFLYLHKPSALPGGLKWSLLDLESFSRQRKIFDGIAPYKFILTDLFHQTSSSKPTSKNTTDSSFQTATYLTLQVGWIY